MKIVAKNPDDYIAQLPDDKREAVVKLREEVLKNLPKGFIECLNYGILGYVIPHAVYPKGYHSDTKLPFPFANIGAQKNFVVFHHLGIYVSPKLLNWFIGEYPKHTDSKLDMGKGCIRFKNPDKIPFKLVGELMRKISAEEWIDQYEKAILNRKNR